MKITKIRSSQSFTELITIAIPCYERKQYFLEALESAINQTVKCEIIVVDNCSSHNYFEQICKDKNVTYYRNERNIGLFPNYNKCYALAKTEYVKILDDDDILLPKYVESFLKAKDHYPEIDIYYSDYLEIKTGKVIAHREMFPFGYIRNGKEIIEYAIKYNLAFPYLTFAIKKNKAQLDLDKNDCVGGYDYVWLYSNVDQLSFYGDSAKLYQWRRHDENASNMSKDWVANVLTIPYIYQTILYPKVSDTTLKNKITNKVFWALIMLKSYGDQREQNKLLNSKNRFGSYLKVRINNDLFLKALFKMPKYLVRVVYQVFRKSGFTS